MSKTCKRSGSRWSSSIIAVTLTGAAAVYGAPPVTPPARTEFLSVNDPRPLADAADQLQKRFGIPITYEDPPYLYSSDIVDLRLEPVESHVDRDHPTWIPRFGRIELKYLVSGGENRIDDLAAALEQAIQVHASNGNAGSFRLDRERDALSLIPTAAKGADGRLAPIKPVLDTEVVLPAGARPGEELLELIMTELNRKSGFKINHGWAVGITHAVESTGGAETARSALRRLLEAQPMKLTWRLFYDPPSREYFLNIIPLPH